MNIFYFSCHAILEYDEIKLFHELGYDVFSAGAYANPAGHPSLPRPGLPQLTHYPELERAASTIRATGGAIPQELIEWADVIIFMHEPEILEKNWQKMKHKRVIFRSIGQCVGHQEILLNRLKQDGLEIVRYSPKEAKIENYAGMDVLIRFYKDPEEYKDWNGNSETVINITQSISQRADFCYFSEIHGAIKDFPSKIYGIGNEDLGELWGGELTDEALRQLLRDSRVYIYGGTYPAQYTLSFIEALMTGIPVITVGRNITLSKWNLFDYLEVFEIIKSGSNGFVGESVNDMKSYIKMLFENKELAAQIGANGRSTAIELFGKETISQQWKQFLR